jgi:hypothetical protein
MWQRHGVGDERTGEADRPLERDCGGDDGTIYDVASPRGMSQEEGLARLKIALGTHDRVALSTQPITAPELIGQAPVYLPPGRWQICWRKSRKRNEPWPPEPLDHEPARLKRALIGSRTGVTPSEASVFCKTANWRPYWRREAANCGTADTCRGCQMAQPLAVFISRAVSTATG